MSRGLSRPLGNIMFGPAHVSGEDPKKESQELGHHGEGDRGPPIGWGKLSLTHVILGLLRCTPSGYQLAAVNHTWSIRTSQKLRARLMECKDFFLK